MAADVNAILVALEGRLSMFEAIGFVKRVQPYDVSAGRRMDENLFDALFK